MKTTNMIHLIVIKSSLCFSLSCSVINAFANAGFYEIIDMYSNDLFYCKYNSFQ